MTLRELALLFAAHWRGHTGRLYLYQRATVKPTLLAMVDTHVDVVFLLPIVVIKIPKYDNISVYSINRGGYTFNITPPSPLSSGCIMFSAYRSVHACDRQT